MQIVCFISCFSLALFRSPLGLIANIKGDRATQTPLLQSLHGKKANLRQDALFIFIKLVSVHKGLVPFVYGEQKSVCSPFQLSYGKKVFYLSALCPQRERKKQRKEMRGSQKLARRRAFIECTFNFFSNYFPIASSDKRECLQRLSCTAACSLPRILLQTKSVTLIDV